MGVSLKSVIRRNYYLNIFCSTLLLKWKQLRSLRSLDLKNDAQGHLSKDIIGQHNHISISRGCRLNNLHVRIRGNNNRIVIKENCRSGEGCSIWAEGNDIEIIIGEDCTFTMLCHFNAQENSTKITIGRDCMFSNNIIIRTSDSHPIFDLETNKRINGPQNVNIGEHVWIAPNTKIMKGSNIADGCIVGSDTTVSRIFDKTNCLIVGRPAKIVKEGVCWTREQLF